MQVRLRVFGRQTVTYHMIRGFISGSTAFRLAAERLNQCVMWAKLSEHSGSPGRYFSHIAVNRLFLIFLVTCSKTVLDPEANPLQLIVTEEADPHEASTGEDEPRTGSSTEAIDERRETEGAIPHLDVVETTLERGLDVEFLIKQQLYPLTGQCWRKQSDVSHWPSQRWFRDTVLLENRCSKNNRWHWGLQWLLKGNWNCTNDVKVWCVE